MILVTVGTQLPFDRLVKAIEDWARESGTTDIVFQVGRNAYHPTIGRTVDFIAAAELEDLLNQAEIVIGHAGIGTIISCLSLNKPVVIMPRLYALGEHRNDHQKASVARLRNLTGVFIADTATDLLEIIEKARETVTGEASAQFSAAAADSLTDYIRKMVL